MNILISVIFGLKSTLAYKILSKTYRANILSDIFRWNRVSEAVFHWLDRLLLAHWTCLHQGGGVVIGLKLRF